MRAMRLFLCLALLMGVAIAVNAQKAAKTVVYEVGIECENCKSKLEKNIPYEKGVKDLKVNLEGRTATVTFREDKNTAEGIKKAIEALKIPVNAYKEVESSLPRENKEEK